MPGCVTAKLEWRVGPNNTNPSLSLARWYSCVISGVIQRNDASIQNTAGYLRKTSYKISTTLNRSQYFIQWHNTSNIRTFSQHFFLRAAAVVIGCCFLTGAAITQKQQVTNKNNTCNVFSDKVSSFIYHNIQSQVKALYIYVLTDIFNRTPYTYSLGFIQLGCN